MLVDKPLIEYGHKHAHEHEVEDGAVDAHGGDVAPSLARQPKTDDRRAAPALTLIQLLAGAGAEVTAHDPVAAEVVRPQLGPHVRLAGDPYAAAGGPFPSPPPHCRGGGGTR